MEYSSQHFSYDHYETRDEAPRESSRRNSISRGRSQVANRRRSRKRTTSTPSCGFNGRRTSRWTW